MLSANLPETGEFANFFNGYDVGPSVYLMLCSLSQARQTDGETGALPWPGVYGDQTAVLADHLVGNKHSQAGTFVAFG